MNRVRVLLAFVALVAACGKPEKPSAKMMAVVDASSDGVSGCYLFGSDEEMEDSSLPRIVYMVAPMTSAYVLYTHKNGAWSELGKRMAKIPEDRLTTIFGADGAMLEWAYLAQGPNSMIHEEEFALATAKSGSRLSERANGARVFGASDVLYVPGINTSIPSLIPVRRVPCSPYAPPG